MKDLLLRPATIDDVPLILSFIKKLSVYEKLSGEVVATEEGLRESLFGNRPAAEVILAFLSGRPVGFALFFHNFSTFRGRQGLYLEDVYVDEDVRGRGIGKRILAELARIAVERRCDRFEWAVLNWNTSAIDFYKSLGAVPMSDWTVFRMTGESLRSLAGNGRS